MNHVSSLRWWVVCGILLLTGCRARQLCQDQDRIRCCVLDMYTNQIMDNLVRLHQCLPIVQMEYTNITGTVSQESTFGVNGSRTSDPVGITRVLGGTLGGTHHNELTITGNPVTNEHDIYSAYLEFVFNKPGRLVVSDCPPPPNAAHIVRRCGKQYYWVPTEYRIEFLDLALRTTALRGEAVKAPEVFENTFVGMVGKPDAEPQPKKKTSWTMLVLFDKPMPNDGGKLEEIAIKGGVYSLTLEAVDKIDGKKVKDGEPTPYRMLTYLQGPQEKGSQAIPLEPQELAAELSGKNVRVRLTRFRPPVAIPTQVLEPVRHQLELIRLQGRR